jgi:hypothetical protein
MQAGAIFKYVPPDQKIAWRDVWVGSIVTAMLFLIGKLLIVVSTRMLLRPRPELRSHGLERAFMRCSRAS